LARIAIQLARFDLAQAEAQLAITLAQAQNLLDVEAEAYRRLGLAADYLNDRETAHTHYLRTLALFQQIGDPHGEAIAYSNLSINAPYRGDFENALRYNEKSLALVRAIGDRQTERFLLANLGRMAFDFGDYKYAREGIQKVYELSRASQDRNMEAWALASLGEIFTAEGDYANGERCNLTALDLTRASGRVNDEMIALHNLAALRVLQDRLEEAADLYQQCATLALKMDANTPPITELILLGHIDLLRGHRLTALQRIEGILPLLTPDFLFGLDYSFQLEWRCYQILHANADPRATQCLQALQTRLHDYSLKLPTQARALFLNLAINQEILSATP
jgi:tetratricopeptide (TPR) repeat protein